ncbi:MAG: F0F1 ATP synthase subunit B [Thermoanaerobaculia bacterium]|nr:F0F1 ATP synthase subunit B [Thermoanaerobaculia bacterium]
MMRSNHKQSRALLTAALLAVAALLLAAPAAFAAGGGEGDGGDLNIFAGDLGNVLWTLLTLGLAVFVLAKYAWNPFLDILQKREDFIRESLAQAKDDREAAEARLAEYEERLTEARAEASAIVEEGRRDAVAVREREEERAKEEAEKMLARAKREIEIAKDTAIKDLYALTGKLATDIASKIVDRELKPADHEKLIHDALDQLLAGKSGSDASTAH